MHINDEVETQTWLITGRSSYWMIVKSVWRSTLCPSLNKSITEKTIKIEPKIINEVKLCQMPE